MKFSRLLLCLIALAAVATSVRAADPAPGVYELRTYTVLPGRMPAMLARFRDHTAKLFEKHGMVNVGYWVPTETKEGTGEQLIYLLAHKSRDAATASWKAFVDDAEWKAVRAKSEADGKIVAKVDAVFLAATNFSKAMDAGNGKGAERVFELRTYTAAEGKLAGLDARFRNHTVALFAKHGMTNLGYFHPTDANKGGGSTLLYFLAYPNRDAAAAAWKGFRADETWTKVRAESEKDGKLTAKVDSVYLKPMDFSKIK